MENKTDHDVPPPYDAPVDGAPPYEARSHDDVQDDPVVDPTIFILAGQSVHAEATSAPPAYELSRAVATLTKSTEKVEFERVDQVVGASTTDGAPTVKRRRRHLYDLRRTVKQPRIGLGRSRSSSDAPEYYIHSLSSRRTLGHLGLAKARHGGFAAGFTAVPVSVPAATTSRARFADGAAPLFALRRTRDRSQWVVADGDETVAIEDAADEQQRLMLLKALPRKDVDALVALWCCRIWQDAAARAEEARSEIGGSKWSSL